MATTGVTITTELPIVGPFDLREPAPHHALIAPTLGERPGSKDASDMRVFGRPGGGGDEQSSELVLVVGVGVEPGGPAFARHEHRCPVVDAADVVGLLGQRFLSGC